MHNQVNSLVHPIPPNRAAAPVIANGLGELGRERPFSLQTKFLIRPGEPRPIADRIG